MPKITDYGGIITEILMEPKEISYIENCIKELPLNGKIVEWGSGGSTCRWVELLSETQRIISIDHKLDWISRTNRAVKKHFDPPKDNLEFIFSPELDNYKHSYGVFIEEHPVGVVEYINPNDNIWDADIYIIDGIARGVCCVSVLLNHKKPNPIILLHDYVGREDWYNWVTNFFDIEIVGETLCRLYIKRTK